MSSDTYLIKGDRVRKLKRFPKAATTLIGLVHGGSRKQEVINGRQYVERKVCLSCSITLHAINQNRALILQLRILRSNVITFLDDVTLLLSDKSACELCKNSKIRDCYVRRFDGVLQHAGIKDEVAIVTLVESKILTRSSQKFRIRMLADKRKYHHQKIFVDFFDKSTGKAIHTVELKSDGSSLLNNITSGEVQALGESMNVTAFSFNFKKMGKVLNIITDFGVEVTITAYSYDSAGSPWGFAVMIRVPYKEYFDKVKGICGNINYDNNCEENGVNVTSTTEIQTLPTTQTGETHITNLITQR